MTPPFDALLQTVPESLQTGRIGTPVAVRLIVHGEADHGLLERLAARGLEAASTWLKSRPQRITALGGSQRGQISLLARFEGGKSALVTVGSSGVGSPLLEAVVWGNRGTVSWEEGAGWLDAAYAHAEPKLSEEAKRLLASVVDSLLESSTRSRSERTNLSESPNEPAPFAAAPIAGPPKPPYGVLLVAGDYTHQPNYAEALAADPRCRLVGLTDEADVSPRRKELNERLARRLDIPVLPDLDQALHREDVQIVSICAEPRRRGRIIARAAEAGKHLYLDKPLAASLRDARDVAKAVEQARVAAHMFSLVPLEPAQRMGRVVRSGELGELTSLHFDLCFAKGRAGTADLGRSRRETPDPQEYELPDAKRELTNVGVYPLVALLWLTGRKVRRVAAATGNFFFQEHQARDMEDFGQMLLELDGGAIATVTAGRTGWQSHPSGGLNRACLLGTKQSAVFDAHRPRAEVWSDAAPWTPPERDPEDPMGMWAGPKAPEHTASPKQAWFTPPAVGPQSDAKYFLDRLESGQPSEISVPLAAHATEILLAAYRSASQDGKLERL